MLDWTRCQIYKFDELFTDARMFGVCHGTIGAVIARRTWTYT